jgi:hypothetical protein
MCNNKSINEPSCCLVYTFTKLLMNFRENLLPCLVPHVGMKFRNPDLGWKFWLAYGSQNGFDARKRYTNNSKIDGKVTSCRFICANEDHLGKDK